MVAADFTNMQKISSYKPVNKNKNTNFHIMNITENKLIVALSAYEQRNKNKTIDLWKVPLLYFPSSLMAQFLSQNFAECSQSEYTTCIIHCRMHYLKKHVQIFFGRSVTEGNLTIDGLLQSNMSSPWKRSSQCLFTAHLAGITCPK